MRVMPSFWARRPVRMAASVLQLDFDIDARGEVELHQRVHGLRGRIDDVQEPLVGADLELLAALLVDMRRTVHGEPLDAGRQRDRAAHLGARALRGHHDLVRRLIENAVVEGFQADADILAVHRLLAFYSMMLATTPAPTVRPPSRMANLR